MTSINSNKFAITLVVIILGSLLLAQGVGAVNHAPQIPGTQPPPVSDVSGVLGIVRGVVQVVYVLFFIIAILFVILAAFTYLTAGGNPEAVGKAKNQIIYAVIAIVVALLSVGLSTIISNFLDSPTT